MLLTLLIDEPEHHSEQLHSTPSLVIHTEQANQTEEGLHNSIETDQGSAVLEPNNQNMPVAYEHAQTSFYVAIN